MRKKLLTSLVVLLSLTGLANAREEKKLSVCEKNFHYPENALDNDIFLLGELHSLNHQSKACAEEIFSKKGAENNVRVIFEAERLSPDQKTLLPQSALKELCQRVHCESWDQPEAVLAAYQAMENDTLYKSISAAYRTLKSLIHKDGRDDKKIHDLISLSLQGKKTILTRELDIILQHTPERKEAIKRGILTSLLRAKNQGHTFHRYFEFHFEQMELYLKKEFINKSFDNPDIFTALENKFWEMQKTRDEGLIASIQDCANLPGMTCLVIAGMEHLFGEHAIDRTRIPAERCAFFKMKKNEETANENDGIPRAEL